MRVSLASRFKRVAIIGLLASLDMTVFVNAAPQDAQPVFSEHMLLAPPSRCPAPIPEFWPHYLVLRRDQGDLLPHSDENALWERRINPTDVIDVREWPFTHLFSDKCGPVVWIAGEQQHA